MKERTAIIPGSFDPLTYGHVDIIRRSASLVDKLYVVVGSNSSKQALFTAEERKEHICSVLSDLENISVEIWDGLTVDFLKKVGSPLIIKGVRDSNDFYYEMEQATANKILFPEHETLLMAADPQLTFVRSSTIKEMVRFGADVSSIVPEVVNRALIEKYKQLT